MDEYLHIDENVNVQTGDAAKLALEKENDRGYLSEGRGVAQVTRKRWDLAQRAERRHWMELLAHSHTDRNWIHERGFDHFRTLQGQSFGHAIEMGCGPFTNLSLIAGHCEIEICSLLDPLIEEYFTHPNCTYTHDSLTVHRHEPRNPLRRALAALRLKSLPPTRVATDRRVPIDETLACPIEEMPSCRRYDLVVVINVIEHCYDIDRVFANILSSMDPGTVLVFHDKMYEHGVVSQELDHVYDAAHPLRVDRNVVRDFLAKHFDPMLDRVVPFSEASFAINDEMLYFIGRRKAF